MPRSRPRVPKNGRSSPLLAISISISNAPGALSSGFAKRRTPICRWAPNLAHVSQLTDGSDPISEFRNLRFPDDKVLCQLKTPVADIPMGRSISATCLNCGTTRIKSRDFARCKVKNAHLCESGCPDLRIGRSRDTRPSLDGRLRFPLAISELEMSRPSRPRELRYP
jgi:hypothetical protein